MSARFNEIQELLRQKADFQSRLNLRPYEGSPEIKESNGIKYLYCRKRAAGKLLSVYVGKYSDILYNQLLKNARETRELKKKSVISKKS